MAHPQPADPIVRASEAFVQVEVPIRPLAQHACNVLAWRPMTETTGEIYERTWPVADPKGVVAISHGLAEHSGRYEHVAQALNAAGYFVTAYDHRGHGRSVGFPAEMGEDVDQLVADCVAHCIFAKQFHDKVFLLAHSMGTMFALPAAAEVPIGTLSGLILSGVALAPGPAVLEGLAEGKGIPANAISRDPAVVKAYEDDPMVFNDVTPKMISEHALDAITKATQAIPMIAIPVLLLHGTNDLLTSLEGANMVHTQLVITDKTLKAYDGLYHEVLNEPEKDQVIGDLIEWLDAH
jgi:alpha-beta hydrolase superfamily lysophospholipase